MSSYAFADAPFTSPEFEELLIGGGKLIWEAGPLAKGSNLCHGTGGNGYAFLKLHRRTSVRRGSNAPGHSPQPL
jgi:hypothetical protein